MDIITHPSISSVAVRMEGQRIVFKYYAQIHLMYDNKRLLHLTTKRQKVVQVVASSLRGMGSRQKSHLDI